MAETEQYYEELTKVIKEFGGTHRTNLVLGDFNARPHCWLPGGERYLGPHTWRSGEAFLKAQSELSMKNRNKLMEFLNEETCTVYNTWFNEQG